MNTQQQAQIIDINTAKVNQLVALRAEKSALEKQIKELETYFKDSGTLFESDTHLVKITSVITNRTDYKAIAEKQGISDYMRKKYTKESTTSRLTVTVKK